MRFGFTDEQRALRDGAREFLAAECPPAAVRAAWQSPDGHDERRWKQLAELGLLGALVPERYGGLGLDEVDLVQVLEEAGYAALPEPLLETAAVAVPVLREAGTPEQQEAWLPRIAAGEAVVTLALEAAPYAVAAGTADLLICERNGALHAVPRDAFSTAAVASMDGARRLFTVDATLAPSTRMAGRGSAFDRAAAATAAFLGGLSQRLLDLTVGYVRERRQFGRPIGSFQAVQHKLAEALVEVETARPAVWYAAYAIARGQDDAAEAASVAKAAASDAHAKANREALQCHGGIGFTWEHDLHLYLKRGKALEESYGSATLHRRRLAASLFD